MEDSLAIEYGVEAGRDIFLDSRVGVLPTHQACRDEITPEVFVQKHFLGFKNQELY